MKKDYFKFMQWAVVYFVPRNTQDDRKDKLSVLGVFNSPVSAEDNFLTHLPNKNLKYYILHVDDLEEFERFYNFVNDLKKQYGDYWIYYLEEGHFTVDQENKFRSILGLWTN